MLLRFRDSAYRTRQNDYNKAQKRGIIASKEFELHMGASLVASKTTKTKQSIQNNWLYNKFHSESGHQIHINGPPRRSVFRFRTPQFKRSASKSILPNSTRFSPTSPAFCGYIPVRENLSLSYSTDWREMSRGPVMLLNVKWRHQERNASINRTPTDEILNANKEKCISPFAHAKTNNPLK